MTNNANLFDLSRDFIRMARVEAYTPDFAVHHLGYLIIFITIVPELKCR